MMEEDVVHQSIHVVRERETVMDLVMVVSMMVMKDAREILCVAATIVYSLDHIIILKMTVVRNRVSTPQNQEQRQQHHQQQR